MSRNIHIYMLSVTSGSRNIIICMLFVTSMSRNINIWLIFWRWILHVTKHQYLHALMYLHATKHKYLHALMHFHTTKHQYLHALMHRHGTKYQYLHVFWCVNKVQNYKILANLNFCMLFGPVPRDPPKGHRSKVFPAIPLGQPWALSPERWASTWLGWVSPKACGFLNFVQAVLHF